MSRASTGSVIVDGARTPIGRFLGSLSGIPASDLGAVAIRAALERSGVPADDVDYVIMGQVLTAGAGQLPARQAAAGAGIPLTVPSTTISKVCLSGLQAIILADQFIRTGDASTVVAGGQESMSRAPHLVPDSRTGHKYGSFTLLDHMAIDGLQDAFDDIAMGLLAERHRGQLSREDQDSFAALSHARADAAQRSGVFDDEVTPVTVPQRREEPASVAFDESIRTSTSIESLAALTPAFSRDGTITAGNASPLSDGACAVVVMSRERAEQQGLTWLAEIRSHGMVAGPDNSLQHQPADAILRACEREGIEPADLELVEINEAFAAVVLASATKLGIGLDRVNVNGGAIALGHPIGASGARTALHLAKELKRRGGGYGAIALCGGGGQGDSLIIKVEGDPS